jgi:ryanodine receptor 2
MFLFAHMQDKLSKHSSQIDLLTELMNLQKDMVVMMLSMLEGNVVNGTIGKQMVDTLVESASNVEMILKFFDMFLKLKDLTSSPSFQELDKDNTGWITIGDFKDKMEQQKTYSTEEIDYILSCCEANVDGKINYIEFTEQFHNPAKEIGFNFAVLLTNLSEHMPSDARLSRFLETAGSVLNYFENVLGRIEICSGHKIERVYFEIDEDNIEQWEKPQIKESKRAFFYSIVTEGGDKEKLEAFVNFCEDAIFEMQHAASLMGESDSSQPTKAQAYTYTSPEEVPEKTPKEKVWDGIKAGFSFIFGLLALLSPSNIKKIVGEIKQMTPAEMAVGFIHLLLRMFVGCGKTGFWCVASGFGVLMTLMKGPPPDPAEVVAQPVEEKTSFKSMSTPGAPATAAPTGPATQQPAAPIPTGLPAIMAAGADVAGSQGTQAAQGGAGQGATPAGDGHHPGDPSIAPEAAADSGPSILPGLTSMLGAAMGGPEEDTMATEEAMAQQQALLAAEEQAKQAAKAGASAAAAGAASTATDEPPPVAQINVGDYTKRVLSFLGRNFYNLKYLALILAFCINFMLLFYRVSTFEEEGDGSEEAASIEEILNSASDELDGSGEVGSGEDGDDDDGGLEIVEIDEKYFYVGYVLRLFAALHILISVAMLIAYYHLKVPLAIFKREKEIARRYIVLVDCLKLLYVLTPDQTKPH